MTDVSMNENQNENQNKNLNKKNVPTALKAYPSTEYIGYYGVREETTYDLLAINADPYYGFVYALTDGKGRIIYAEQIFCNYSMDLDYRAYIPEEYLLDGFDASLDNEYELKMMGD